MEGIAITIQRTTLGANLLVTKDEEDIKEEGRSFNQKQVNKYRQGEYGIWSPTAGQYLRIQPFLLNKNILLVNTIEILNSPLSLKSG